MLYSMLQNNQVDIPGGELRGRRGREHFVQLSVGRGARVLVATELLRLCVCVHGRECVLKVLCSYN